MTTDITIPPEALEAAARETYIEWVRGCLLDDPTASIDDYERWEHLDEAERGHYISTARAACLAMLKNWPGMAYRYRMSVSLEPQEIILPLQEKPDDEG